MGEYDLGFDEIIGYSIIILLIGIVCGLLLAEVGKDIIYLDVLDDVCHELYGNNTKYYERNDGISNEFICKNIKIPKPPLPKIRLE